MWCQETESVLREAKRVREQLAETLRTLEQFEQRLRAVTEQQQQSPHEEH
jgi:hypothetical protein